MITPTRAGFRFFVISLIMLFALSMIPPVSSWGNGNSLWGEPTFVDDPMLWQRTNMFGTHDYFAKAALEMLARQAPEEAEWVSERLYLYGTELPDSSGYAESINDLLAQYLRFDEKGNLLDASLAKRSMKRYELLINSLASGATGTASKWAGVIASYISDAGLFTRVLDNKKHGIDYETYMLRLTDITYPSDEFQEVYGSYIKFDGRLEIISPYDAVLRVGVATYLGRKDGSCSAEWMDNNYDLNDPQFIECTGRNINNIINAIADVLHTAYQAGVNGLEYEWYAHDWGHYSDWAVSSASPGTEGQPAGEPEATKESGQSEPVQESKEVEETAREVAGVVFKSESPVAPAGESAPGVGSWPSVIALALIAAIVVITLFRMRREGEPGSRRPDQIPSRRSSQRSSRMRAGS